MTKARLHNVFVRFALLAGLLGTSSPLFAETFVLSIQPPDFIIPVGGQSSVLNAYMNGTAQVVSGYNSLGSQTFTLGPGATSTGTLDLNLYFSGYPLGDTDYYFDTAKVDFTVRDFDFLTDYVTSKITLTEVAILQQINGVTLSTPINLADYLPAGTVDTDDETITLNPINIREFLDREDFTDPFILSLKLTATVKNNGTTSKTLVNTPEALVAAKLTVTPEPSTLLLLSSGLVGMALWKRSRSRRD